MLTHIDQQNNPTMVDVSDKLISKRRATALSTIILPEAMREYFKDDDFIMKKGPVFHTAIIAGTMAVKKTYDFIPFCHQIPIESCKFIPQEKTKKAFSIFLLIVACKIIFIP